MKYNSRVRSKVLHLLTAIAYSQSSRVACSIEKKK